MITFKKKAILTALCTSLFANVASAGQVEVTIASFPNFNLAAEAAAPMFEKAHPNIKLKFITLAYGDHHNAMTTALATGANLPDVMGVEASYIGRFAESGGLENLDAAPYNAGSFSQQIVPFTLGQASDSDGALRAMPADIGPGALFYRKDVLATAGVSEADLVKSWDSFIEAGIKIKKETGAYLIANATDINDIVIRSGIKEGEGLYFDKDHNILVNTPRFKEGFRLSKAARDAGIDGKISPWTNEWTEGLKRGTITVQMMGAWIGGHLEEWIAPDDAGKWRAADLPNKAFASFGGSFFAIPAKATHKPEAWEFIKFMALNQEAQLLAFKTINAFPSLIDAQTGPMFDEEIAYLGGQKARLKWREAALKIPFVAMDRYDEVARQIIADSLEKVLEHDADIDTVLADAEKQIKRRARRR